LLPEVLHHSKSRSQDIGDASMILLRRGRPGTLRGAGVEVDVAFDLGPAFRQRRQECTAPWRPPIEVFETVESLMVRAEIGGLTTAATEVLIDENLLVIRGERAMASGNDHRLYHESRGRYGPFEAQVNLPFPVDVPEIEAEYVDGFLTVRLPRLAATRLVAERPGVGEKPARSAETDDDE
jgi:HSP20 family protein